MIIIHLRKALIILMIIIHSRKTLIILMKQKWGYQFYPYFKKFKLKVGMHISFYSILPWSWVHAHVGLLWPRHRARTHAMAFGAMAFGCMPMLVCHGLGSVHRRMPWLLAACPCWIPMA